MTKRLILASKSSARRRMLENAGVTFEAVPARIDEEMVRQSMLAEAHGARDVADALAELKAVKVSEQTPGALVLGSDQVLEFDGAILAKPASPAEAIARLTAMRSRTHTLYTAAVIAEDGTPVWRQVNRARMTMHDLSQNYLEAYVTRNWTSIRETVGAYKLEEEGVRLFSGIDGDFFSILGLPIIAVLSFLTVRGDIET